MGKSGLRIFLPAFLQVALVCSNALLIVKFNYVGVLIVGFFISLMWCLNVKSALGTWKTKLIYCTGASLGGVAGVYLTQLITG